MATLCGPSGKHSCISVVGQTTFRRLRMGPFKIRDGVNEFKVEACIDFHAAAALVNGERALNLSQCDLGSWW